MHGRIDEKGEDALKEESEVSQAVCLRLDDFLGALEWLKVDQAKKRGWNVRDGVVEISSLMERIAERLEGQGAEGNSPRFKEAEGKLKRLSELNAELLDLLDAMGERISRMSAEQVVPGQEDMEALRGLVLTMDKKVMERKALLFG